MAQEQIPVLKEKYHIAIRALSEAPRQLDELRENLLNKKVKFGNITVLNSAGTGSPSWSNQLLIEIQEYEWILTHFKSNKP